MIDYEKFAFIFDMDGTLVDNMRFHTLAWQKMLGENGVQINAEEFLIKTAGRTNREIIPAIFPEATETEVIKLSERKESLYRELFLPYRKPLAGAVEFLTKSQKLRLKMAVATAAPLVNVGFILDGLGMRKFFHAITTADDVTNGKPHPEFFLQSAAKVGVNPSNCIVFEDALNGFEAAFRAGMKSVGIATVNSIEDILQMSSVVEAHRDFTNLNPQLLIEKYL